MEEAMEEETEEETEEVMEEAMEEVVVNKLLFHVLHKCFFVINDGCKKGICNEMMKKKNASGGTRTHACEHTTT